MIIGILQRAADAKERTGITQTEERIQLAYLAGLTGGKGNIDKDSFLQELKKEFGAENVKENNIVESADGKRWTVTIDSATVELEAGIKTTSQIIETIALPTALGTKPYFPSDKFSQLEGTNLTNGLVITDHKTDGVSDGNEYVWIEVPSTAVDSTATGGPDYSGVSGPTDYTNIATALRNYCTKDASNANLIKIATSGTYGSTSTYGYTDTWYSGCGITDSGSYTTLYNKMLKSIYENGGFWIGRYEAGTTTARKEGDSASGITPLSKIDLYPMNWITCSEAQTIAGSVPCKGSYNSSLMFGIQWDLVLRHLSNKGVTTNLLTGNSSTWGNYYNQQFEINRGKYSWADPYSVYIDYTTETLDKVTVNNNVSTKVGTTVSNRILITTGAADVNSKINIYDLAGNVREWTLEKSSTTNRPHAYRGGSMYEAGSVNPASNRYRAYTNTKDNITRFSCCNLLKILNIPRDLKSFK